MRGGARGSPPPPAPPRPGLVASSPDATALAPRAAPATCLFFGSAQTILINPSLQIFCVDLNEAVVTGGTPDQRWIHPTLTYPVSSLRFTMAQMVGGRCMGAVWVRARRVCSGHRS
jgi:hypothetical protein